MKLFATDDGRIAQMMREDGHNAASIFAGFIRNPSMYDGVVLSGGCDVGPQLYGDTSPHGLCRFNTRRDEVDAEVYRIATSLGMPVLGICRGLQFMAVMNGHKLWHHINRHEGVIHSAYNSYNGTFCGVVNSFHHQAVMPGVGEMMCHSRGANRFVGDNDEQHDGEHFQVEAMCWRDRKCFGVQFHPEYCGHRSEERRLWRRLLRESGVMS